MRQDKLGLSEFNWDDLHSPEGLKSLFEEFLVRLKSFDDNLFQRYESYLNGEGLSSLEESSLLLEVAPRVSHFLELLFGICQEHEALKQADLNLKPVFLFKRDFVQRRVLKDYPDQNSIAGLNKEDLEEKVEFFIGDSSFSLFPEEAVARFSVQAQECLKTLGSQEKLTDSQDEFWNDLSSKLKKKQSLGTSANMTSSEKEKVLNDVLSDLAQWVACLYHSGEGKDWASFQIPKKFNFDELVHLERPDPTLPEKIQGPKSSYRRRDGFKLTDKRMSVKEVMGQVEYCLYCHDREKDSCSKGLVDKKTNSLSKNPLGIKLAGCPLDEKISEAHSLRKHGDSIAALAMIVVDNPMCPGTGHRICNDCMKACIFQKQEPVNIPQIETNILTQVLKMPNGFEIYSLLTRWNPLNRKRPYALPYNGKNILVVGQGPAGYTLAHYLLNEGFGVVGIDGLKVEPLSEDLVNRVPVKNIEAILDDLDKRPLAGFGGVAEYGITVRWDKNFLKLIYLNIARRLKYKLYGGIRFGGTVTIEDAWRLGFDHIAMATGAGKPTIVPMKNNLIRGVRKASDFLMALQLTGAFKKDNMANLQIRLPAVVIGGGLTGVDTATEIMAYYPIQVEKFLNRYERLQNEFGQVKLDERLSDEDKEIRSEFLEHGRQVRQERERAQKAGEDPNFIPLLRQWGGVHLVYRKSLQEAPAYRLNHEEVEKAFEEGIFIIENMNPQECLRGVHGSLDGMIFERQKQDEAGKWLGTGELVKIPAKSVCVAAGTSPNTIYEKEKPGTFEMDEWKWFFKTYDNDGSQLKSTDQGSGFMSSYDQDDKRISFYGDNHPGFAGNVVKAMASAKKGYPKVRELFEEEFKELDPQKQIERETRYHTFRSGLDQEFLATIKEVKRLTSTITEVIVKAPLAAKRFQPGQFYRLQNYEAHALEIDHTKLTTEGLALTGAWNDPEKGLLSTIILEMGTSSRLCASLKPGTPVVLMGPTGAPTEIPENETVMLLGGGLGNAVLFSIGQAMRKAGNKVIYFAGYKNSADRFREDDVEASADVLIWANDIGDAIPARRPQDKSFTGNIVQAAIAYAEGKLGDQPISLKNVDRIVAIGSDRMMAAVKQARFDSLKPYLKEDHVAIGSINSPMQCMMKEVCAQCLQKHVDPKTGEETKPVFSCFNQDQCLDKVDFQNLNERLQTNHLSENLSSLWLDHLFNQQHVERV